MGAAKPALRGTQIVGKAVVRSDLMILIIIGSDLVQSDLIVESDWLIGSGLYHHRIRLDHNWIRLGSSSDQI